jgi:DNA polymerase III delta prime subunit
MDSIINTFKKTGYLHHAYLVEGDKKEVFTGLCGILENELCFPTKGNPDFWCGEFDTFGIDDGRMIKELQTRRSVVHNRKIFILSANFFTTEAQNSLLKVFEEPTEDTHFFIIIRNIEILLPTLRSRMLILPRLSLGKNQKLIIVEEFLKSCKAKRLSLLKEIIEEKDKFTAISFLNELEEWLYKQFGSKASKSLEEIIKGKKYLNGRAPSTKMILEHIALVVPTLNKKYNTLT